MPILLSKESFNAFKAIGVQDGYCQDMRWYVLNVGIFGYCGLVIAPRQPAWSKQVSVRRSFYFNVFGHITYTTGYVTTIVATHFFSASYKQ
jgi:hypothetical protein